MTRLRTHWRMSLVSIALVLCAGLFWWRAAEARSLSLLAMLQAPVGNPLPEPLSVLHRDAIVQILADLSLDRDALIALNLTSEQTESVLSTVRTWRTSNEATLASLKNAVDLKIAAVYALEKAVAMGPADAQRDAALALARQDLGSARSAYRAGYTSLESSVSEIFSASQRATWTAIRAGHGQHMPIRMLALSDAQRLAYSDAKQRYDRQQAAASNAEERASAVTTWQNALDQILTAEQKTIVQSYHSSYASASAAVNGALDTVLATSAG